MKLVVFKKTTKEKNRVVEILKRSGSLRSNICSTFDCSRFLGNRNFVVLQNLKFVFCIVILNLCYAQILSYQKNVIKHSEL